MKLRKKKEKEEELNIEKVNNDKQTDEFILEEKKEKDKEKKLKNNMTYLFFKAFMFNLRENKLYFLSFFITIFSLVFFSVTKVKEADGIYSSDSSLTNTPATPVVDTNVNKPEEKVQTSLEVDVSDYIGIYSREVKLVEPITVNETCKIESYKFLYQVKKDKTITKYLMNDCVGTIKMWSDKASYVSSGGAKYISANKISYLFSPNISMKEIDGETYNIDETITTIKEAPNKDNEVYFYGDNIVIKDKTNLVLLKGNTILYNLNNNYPNNGGNLEMRVYKAGATDQFNFIVFSNNDSKNNCYTEFSENDEDSLVYTIYSIKYNTSSNSFDEAKKILTRNKSEKCDNYDDDMKILTE